VNKKEVIIKSIGIYLLTIGILSILYALFIRKTPEQIIWLCYISLILFGAGIILKNYRILIVQSSIMLIPLIVWNIDFFYNILTGSPLWGITDYFFTEGHTTLERFISLQHVYTLPLVFFVIRSLKSPRKLSYLEIVKLSFIQMVIIFILGRLFTPMETNMNCVFENCLPFSLPYYELFWFVTVILGISLSTKVIFSIIKK
jgi:hypothetical protein